jgi:hypothetical protein
MLYITRGEDKNGSIVGHYFFHMPHSPAGLHLFAPESTRALLECTMRLLRPGLKKLLLLGISPEAQMHTEDWAQKFEEVVRPDYFFRPEKLPLATIVEGMGVLEGYRYPHQDGEKLTYHLPVKEFCEPGRHEVAHPPLGPFDSRQGLQGVGVRVDHRLEEQRSLP